MSITNYTELKTAVADFLHRDNLTTQVVDFITIAEKRINRKMRLLNQEFESEVNFDPVNAVRTLAIPTGFLEMLNVHAKKTTETFDKYLPVTYISPQLIYTQYSEKTSRPNWYTVRQTNVEFEQLPDVIYTIKFNYLKKWDIATDTTNWLLTEYPDIYLYGALLTSAPYIRDKSILATWKGLFDEAMNELDELDRRTKDDAELSTLELYKVGVRNYRYNIDSDTF